MKPVFQTRFGRPLGNCWAAAIASVLEVPLEAVDWAAGMAAEEVEPPGATDVSPEWLRRRDERLEALGYWLCIFTPVAWPAFIPAGAHYLALGQTASGVGHVCVHLDGQLVHNPNHNPATELVAIEYLGVLVRR